MNIRTFTIAIALVPAFVHGQTTAEDRALVKNFEQIANDLTPVFDQAVISQAPDPGSQLQVQRIFERTVNFQKSLLSVQEARLNNPAKENKTLSLLQLGATMLDFTQNALWEWLSTRDQTFLTMARQGMASLTDIRGIITPRSPPEKPIKTPTDLANLPLATTTSTPSNHSPVSPSNPPARGSTILDHPAGPDMRSVLSIKDAEERGLVRTFPSSLR